MAICFVEVGWNVSREARAAVVGQTVGGQHTLEEEEEEEEEEGTRVRRTPPKE